MSIDVGKSPEPASGVAKILSAAKVKSCSPSPRQESGKENKQELGGKAMETMADFEEELTNSFRVIKEGEW